ncbi:MAG: response regulator [Persicimonas sp.]
MRPKTQQMMTEEASESLRILFTAQNPHDAKAVGEVFEAVDLDFCPLDDLADVLAEVERGAGVLIIAEEKLEHGEFDRLEGYLGSQPAWSDLPLLVITRNGEPSDAVRRLSQIANVTLIERPVHLESLLSMTIASLRDRRRQYDIRRSITNRDSFLAMLGHELRNPLAAIILALEQLSNDRGNDDALEIIRRQSGNLERIVDDLLEVSRISRGVISFAKERVDVVELVRETTDAFRNLAREQGLGWTVDLSDAPLWVQGDAVRLEQALGNLLSNAIRYTPPGEGVAVQAESQEGTIVISVRDTGMGIPAEMIDNIFELFAQAHGDFSRREGGLGLGLSLAHSIVRKHDGELIAESEGEGMGSQFFIRLPAADTPRQGMQPISSSDAAADEPTDGVTDGRPGLRILVIEDVDDLRIPFCQMLRLRGHTVEEAATGEAGLEAADEGDHDVILLDIGLPDIDGFEVTRRIRQRRPEVAIIALTGYGRNEDREQAERAGFDSLLVKPVSLDELEEVLDSVTLHAPDTEGR